MATELESTAGAAWVGVLVMNNDWQILSYANTMGSVLSLDTPNYVIIRAEILVAQGVWIVIERTIYRRANFRSGSSISNLHEAYHTTHFGQLPPVGPP